VSARRSVDPGSLAANLRSGSRAFSAVGNGFREDVRMPGAHFTGNDYGNSLDGVSDLELNFVVK